MSVAERPYIYNLNSSMVSLCRICLGEEATIPIFEDFSIQDKLTLCFNAKFKKIAGYPLCICNYCHDTLNITFEFINKYKETCEILEKRLKVSVKKELVDAEDNDTFEPEPIIDQFKIEIEVEPKYLVQNDAICNKTTKKRTIKRENNTKMAVKVKPRNKTPTHKINTRKSSALDNGDVRKLDTSKAVKKPSKLVPCETCGSKFKSPEKLKLHEELKHKNLKLVCDICDAKFSSKADLHRHLKRIHSEDKDFICSKCGKGFAFLGDLNIHTRGVHEKTLQRKNPKKIPCKLCDKEYISKTLLLIHERSAHTGERPAVCTVCDKSFFHEDYLKQHMRLHTGERPYECPVCGHGYAQLGNMKSHMRNHRISQLRPETLSQIKPSWHKFMRQ